MVELRAAWHAAMDEMQEDMMQPVTEDMPMNHEDGWMHGWRNGGMWIWPVVGVLVVVLLVVVILKVINQERKPMLTKTPTKKTVSAAATALQAAVSAHHFGFMQVHNLQATMVKTGVAFTHECSIFEVCHQLDSGVQTRSARETTTEARVIPVVTSFNLPETHALRVKQI